MSFAPGAPGSAAGSGYAPVTYQRLMRLAARAFYSGPCPPPERDTDALASKRSKIAKMDTRGLGVVLVDYLTTVEWTSSDLLQEALRLHPVVLSKALRFLEAGHMIRRYERRESRRKKRNIVGEALEADVAGGGDSDDDSDEEGEGGAKKKTLLTEYFTLDYARAFDALQVRIHTMRASLKEQLEATNAIQAYRCPGPFCGKTYTSLDAANLVDPVDLTFKCEICGSELVEQRATNDAEGGAPQHTTAKESKEAARRLLQAIDRELAPITRLMADIQHRAVPLPDPGELYEWAQRVRQREADLSAVAGGGGGGAAGRAGGAAGAGGGGAGAGGAGGAPAALLAGSGVTVLSAADNTNTWEAQDFKVSLDGGAAGGGGLLFGGGAAAAGAAAAAPAEGGGKKAAKVLPWFMKATDGKAGSAAGDDDGAAAAAAATSSAAGAGAASGKQQQQAEYFRDFMAYMSKLQQEKREPKAEAPAAAPPGPVPAAAAPFVVKPEPGLAAAPPPGPVSSATLLPSAVKQEPVAAYGTADDVEWEAVGGLPPAAAAAAQPSLLPLQPKVEEVKTELGMGGFGGASGGGGGATAMDADGDVEWEDV